ncbi:MAG: hypothetical protein VKP72_03040 [bacterium]|nr:hypothetical protein [bacterium]
MTPISRRTRPLLALSTLLLAGCLASPVVVQTRMPDWVGETYGDNPNPPHAVEAVPIGAPVTIPPGKAAVTLLVVIPRKADDAQAPRNAQAIDFSRITRVDVSVVGENLSNPVTTSIQVSSGASAAGTIVLPAGRNQVITAVGRDGNGTVVSTVKGVATSQPGKVVQAQVMFGTTPLARVIEGLNPDLAPRVNLDAVHGVIDPLLGASETNGNFSYATHPAFINPAPLVAAIQALVAGGTAPEQLNREVISSQLQGTQPLFLPSEVTIALEDIYGRPYSLTGRTGYQSWSQDRDQDGSPDGSNVNDFNVRANYLSDLRISDPVSETFGYWGEGSEIRISHVPPGDYSLSYGYEYMSPKPWWVLPTVRAATVSVSSGSRPRIPVRFVDVSRPVTVNATGSFESSSNYSIVTSAWAFEWYRFEVKPDVVYTTRYQFSNGNGGQPIRVFDETCTQLYQSTDATGSFVYASPATHTLYVYTPWIQTHVDIEATPLAEGRSLYNTTIQYNR